MALKYRFFEDYQVGQAGITASRTIGEAAISTFSHLTGDYSPEHLDRHGGAKSPYGERVAHGLLGSCLAPGMISLSAPHVVGRGVPDAFLRAFECNYRKAIPLGDTITVRWRVIEMADDVPGDGLGLVTTSFDIVNQNEVAVYDGTLLLLVRTESGKNAKPRFEAGKPWEIKPFVHDSSTARHLEDYAIGAGEESAGRTITEADVVNFCGLTGDLNPLYVDSVYARQSVFGERTAPPMLVFCAIFPLLSHDGDILKAQRDPEAGKWAGHLADGATFLAPVRIGDTLRCRCRVQSTRPSKTKPHIGVLKLGLQIINQRNEVVQEGYIASISSTRPVTLEES